MIPIDTNTDRIECSKYTIKNSRFSASFRGIIRLRSAFIFCDDSNLHIPVFTYLVSIMGISMGPIGSSCNTAQRISLSILLGKALKRCCLKIEESFAVFAAFLFLVAAPRTRIIFVFADDMLLLASFPEGFQHALDRISAACNPWLRNRR